MGSVENHREITTDCSDCYLYFPLQRVFKGLCGSFIAGVGHQIMTIKFGEGWQVPLSSAGKPPAMDPEVSEDESSNEEWGWEGTVGKLLSDIVLKHDRMRHLLR
jgi:hypothetical protein